MGYRVAVVGATGNVGREMMNILAEREFPVDECFAIASRRSIGVDVSFGDKNLKCKDMETFDFSKVDFVLMAAGSEIAKTWAPKIGATGAIVIDNSSFWRYDQEVPLIVPEVNAHVIDGIYEAQHQAQHHCQSQLLNRANGRGAEAFA
jgi:aspartate-semialdehyde dehydrogenase